MKKIMNFLLVIALGMASYQVFAKTSDKQTTTTPYGWSKGKKVGWEGKSMPPGQVKKAAATKKVIHNKVTPR